MKVKRILIDIELDEKDNPGLATKLEFGDGIWNSNGGVYPRISLLQTVIWELTKTVIIDGGSVRDYLERKVSKCFGINI